MVLSVACFNNIMSVCVLFSPYMCADKIKPSSVMVDDGKRKHR